MKYFLIRENEKIMIIQALLKVIHIPDFKIKTFSIIRQEEETPTIRQAFKTFLKIFLEVSEVSREIEAKTTF